MNKHFIQIFNLIIIAATILLHNNCAIHTGIQIADTVNKLNIDKPYEKICDDPPGHILDFFKDINSFSQPLPIFNEMEGVKTIKGFHEDLYVKKRGLLASKNHGWSIVIPFRKYLIGDFDKSWLIVTSHSINDDYSSLIPFKMMFYVISKTDGKITRWVQIITDGKPQLWKVDGGNLYYNLHSSPGVIRMLPIS